MAKDIKEILHFHISPSRRITLISGALHCLAILACWFNNLFVLNQTILTGIILILWRLEQRCRRSTAAHLSYTGSNGWRLSTDGNKYFNIVILDATVITSVMIFFHYKTENQACGTLLIGKDSLSSYDEFRRLKVRLTLSLQGQ